MLLPDDVRPSGNLNYMALKKKNETKNDMREHMLKHYWLISGEEAPTNKLRN